MKKLFSVILAIVCCALPLASCGKDYPEIGDMYEVFPRTMRLEYSNEFELVNEIEEIDESLFNADVKIYYAKNRYSLLYKNRLLKKFGFKASDLSTDSDSERLYYKDGERMLTIETDSGHFSYKESSMFKNKSNVTDFEKAERECIEILKNYGLMYDDCERGGNFSVSENDAVYTYGPNFVQVIDGIPVKWNGQLSACVKGDGKLTDIDDSTCDYEYLTTFKTRSFEEAFNKITDKESNAESNINGKIDRAVFTEVELVYFKSDFVNYFVPCYHFEGTAYVGDKASRIYADVIAVENLEGMLWEFLEKN